METDLQVLNQIDNFIVNCRFIDSDIKESCEILEIIFRNIFEYESF